MSSIAVRPHTKFMSAVLAAGLVTAAAPAWVPPVQQAAPVVSNAAVLPASAITDLLENVGVGVQNLTRAISNPLIAATSLRFDAAYAVLASLRDPELIGSVVSYLSQSYLNPVFEYGGYAARERVYLDHLALLAPSPVNGWLRDGIDGVSAGIGSAFDRLWDPAAGGEAMARIAETELGRSLWAIRSAMVAPVMIIAQAVTYLGYLPAQLVETLEAAVRTPADIPGLISNLALGLIDPAHGLLGVVLADLVRPLTLLPAPVGNHRDGDPGWAASIYVAVVDAVSDFLHNVLPTPITPNVPAARTATVDVSVPVTEAVTSLPAAVATTVTLDVPASGSGPVVEDVVPLVMSEDAEDREAVEEEAVEEEAEVAEPATEDADADADADKSDSEDSDSDKADSDKADSDKADNDKTDNDKTDSAKTDNDKSDSSAAA